MKLASLALVAGGSLLAQCATEAPIADEPYVPVPRLEVDELWPGDWSWIGASGKSSTFLFGSELATAGDLDGDGLDDLLIGDIRTAASTGRPEGSADMGRVWAVSSADFEVLWSASFPLPDDLMHLSISAIGDADEDGVADLVVGCGRLDSQGPGPLRVISGARGGVVYSLEVPADLHSFGNLVCGVGDLDADGLDDFIASAAASPDERPELVLAYSARTGRLLHRAQSASNVREEPEQLFRARDLDGDGVHDYLVDALCRDDVSVFRSITSYSGVDGSELQRLRHCGRGVCVWLDPIERGDTAVLIPVHTNFQLYTLPGRELIGTWYTRKLDYPGIPIALPDLNDDGLPELLFGQRSAHLFDCTVLLWPSLSAKPTYFLNSRDDDTWRFGHNLAVIGDHDADGVPDLAVGVNHLFSGSPGRVFLISTRTGTSIGELRRVGDALEFRSEPPGKTTGTQP